MPTLDEDLLWLQDTLHECNEEEAYALLDGYVEGCKEYPIPIREYTIFMWCFIDYNIC